MIKLVLYLYLVLYFQISFQTAVVVLYESKHDNSCFTQGLQLIDHLKLIYETCGLYGKSLLRELDSSTAMVLKEYKFPNTIFAEGLVVVNNLIYVLSWQESILFIFNRESFQVISTMKYTTQGWGITFDSTHLIASDGSDKLYFYELPNIDENTRAVSEQELLYPQKTLVAIKTITVFDQMKNANVNRLNELEFVNGIVYANVWMQDYIYKIDPLTGFGEEINLKHLYPHKKRIATADCLNGIAYNKEADEFILTGKLWPFYFHVKLETIAPFINNSNSIDL